MSKKEIVKIQVPLGGTKLAVLIYNQDRSIMYQDESIESLQKFKRILGGRPKGYFFAEPQHDGTFLIDFAQGELPAQPW